MTTKQRIRRRRLARRYSDVQKNQSWYIRLFTWRLRHAVKKALSEHDEKLRKWLLDMVPMFADVLATGGAISGEVKYLAGTGLGSGFALAAASPEPATHTEGSGFAGMPVTGWIVEGILASDSTYQSASAKSEPRKLA